MAFPTMTTRVPTSIGNISYTIGDPDGDNAHRTIGAHVEVLDAGGEIMATWDDNLKPELTSGQLTAFAEFLNVMRARFEAELLP